MLLGALLARVDLRAERLRVRAQRVFQRHHFLSCLPVERCISGRAAPLHCSIRAVACRVGQHIGQLPQTAVHALEGP